MNVCAKFGKAVHQAFLGLLVAIFAVIAGYGIYLRYRIYAFPSWYGVSAPLEMHRALQGLDAGALLVYACMSIDMNNMPNDERDQFEKDRNMIGFFKWVIFFAWWHACFGTFAP
jgi:hypothetical protein